MQGLLAYALGGSFFLAAVWLTEPAARAAPRAAVPVVLAVSRRRRAHLPLLARRLRLLVPRLRLRLGKAGGTSRHRQEARRKVAANRSSRAAAATERLASQVAAARAVPVVLATTPSFRT